MDKQQVKGSGTGVIISPFLPGLGPRFHHNPPKHSWVDRSVFTALSLPELCSERAGSQQLTRIRYNAMNSTLTELLKLLDACPTAEPSLAGQTTPQG